MLSAETSIPLRLATILDDLERNVSLGGKIMKMEEFISTLSLCSRASIGADLSVSLMLGDATLILSAAMEHRRRVTTTRSNMEMSSQEGWEDRAEFEFLRLAIRGLTSSFQRLVTSFLRLSRNWLLGHFALALHPCELMQIGDIENPLNPTERLREFRFERTITHNSLIGYNKLWADLDLKVSDSCTSRHVGARPIPAGSAQGHVHLECLSSALP